MVSPSRFSESKAQKQKQKILLCNKSLTSDYILHTSTDEFTFQNLSLYITMNTIENTIQEIILETKLKKKPLFQSVKH